MTADPHAAGSTGGGAVSGPDDGADRDALVQQLAARIAAHAAQQPPLRTASPEGDDAARARDIVLRQLAVMPRPRATLASKLRQKEIPDEVASAVLDRYTELGLIDDRAFAELYVSAKHRDRGLGRYALRAELRRQGVAEDDLQDAVGTIDDDAERRRAEELVGKRLASALAAGPEAARRRLLGQLSRRGYPPGLAVSVVEQALADAGAAAPAGHDSLDD